MKMFEPGDVVYIEGASAILGDVVAVDAEEDQVTVVWRETETTEVTEDLERYEEVRPDGPETDRGGLIGQQPY